MQFTLYSSKDINHNSVQNANAAWNTILWLKNLQQHWLMLIKVGFGRISKDKGCSTKWRAVSTWIVVCSAWPTARCHRSVTRTTTVLLTSCVSSTHDTPHTLDSCVHAAASWLALLTSCASSTHTTLNTLLRLVCPRCCQWTCPSDKLCQFNTHDTPLVASSSDMVSDNAWTWGHPNFCDIV